MSAGAPQGGDDGGEEFEINLAPIIDCLTVLITYLLISTSFISLDMLDVQLATAASVPLDEKLPEPQASLSVELGENHNLEFQVSGIKEERYSVPAGGNGDWDLTRMNLQIEEIRRTWPTIKEVSVKAVSKTQYKEIVRVVENLKKVLPKVYLGE